MDLKRDISSWKIDAHNKLSEAQQVCNKANEFIMRTTKKLTEREDNYPKLIYYLDATKQQLRLLGIIKDSLSLNIHKVVEKKTSLKNKINRDLNKLNSTVTTLKSIKVDKSINHTESVLFDYVSEGNLNELYRNISENLKELDELLKNNRTDALIIRISSDLDNLQNEFNSLSSQFIDLKLDPGVHIKGNSNNDPINKLIEINNELEMDMVSILQSFNNHYDQCVKGVDLLNNDLKISTSDKLDLINVLSNDVQELPQAMNYLKNDSEIIIKNCKEILKILNIFENFFNKIEMFMIDLKQYGELKLIKQLDEFNEINSKMNGCLVKTEDYKLVISDYIKDYNQFITSYYSLIIELQRRLEMNNKLSMLVEEFKVKLNGIINDDFDKRIQFLNNNGDFLPGNLIDSSVINDSAPLIEINLDVEQFPSLKSETVSEAIRYLNS